MSAITIEELIGESGGSTGFGENLSGPDLSTGYLPERNVEFVPLTMLGPPLVGPPNEQLFEIYRDRRPIPADEIGMQGPFMWRKIASHSAGRVFPLNLEWNAGIDQSLPGRPATTPQDSRWPTPLGPGQLPHAHAGFAPVEIVDSPWTVYYTASPNVGWDPTTSP